MKYVVEVWKDGKVKFPKSSQKLWELKEWIHEKYPTAYRLPVLPSEVFGELYVCKYSTHFAGKNYFEKPVTIYIKRSF